jgi:GNAT superfamily N-acetyltransferase
LTRRARWLTLPATMTLHLPPIGAATVRRLSRPRAAEIDALADVLIDCVDGGASVSFISPLSRDRALAFWSRVAEETARGERALLVAEDASGIVGTVQLVLAQPENQPHRADLSKMLVHRRARRKGLGVALLHAAEQVAHACGKTLLVLDTASADAERLYQRLGWQRVGVVPNYALLPDGGLCDTVFFYRELGPQAGGATPPRGAR